MDRVRKTNILLEYADQQRLADELRGLEEPPATAGSPSPTGRIKVLFLASNPATTTRLHLDREVRQIEDRIGVGKPRDVIELVPRWAVRRRDLQRLLLEEKPHVLHFSSHGTPEAQLLLEDDDGAVAAVEKAALVGLSGLLRHRLRLVMLNACDSEPVARALVRHVACAIGMRRTIDDTAATAFAASFYQAIGFEEPVATAFALGCNELALHGISAQGTPTLKVRQGVDAASLVLTR